MPHFVQCFSQLTKPPLLPGFPIAILIAMFDYRRAMFDLPIRCGKPGYNPLATRKPRTKNLPHHDFHEKSERSILRFHDIRAVQFIFKVTEIGAIIPCLDEPIPQLLVTIQICFRMLKQVQEAIHIFTEHNHYTQ